MTRHTPSFIALFVAGLLGGAQVTAQPSDPVAAFGAKAIAALTRGDVQSARALARDQAALALKLHGKDSQEYKAAMVNLGLAAGMSGDNQGFAALFTKAAQHEKDEGGRDPINTIFTRVAALRAQGNTADALTVLRGAEPRLKTIDDKANFYGQLGDLLAAKRDFAGATDAYEKAAQAWLGRPNPPIMLGLEMVAKKALSLHQNGKEAAAGKLFDEVYTRVAAEHVKALKSYKSMYGSPSAQTKPVSESDATQNAMKTALLQIGTPLIAASFEAAGRGAQVTAWRRGQIVSPAPNAAMPGSPYNALNRGELVNNLLDQPGKEVEALSAARTLASGVENYGNADQQSLVGQRARNYRRDYTAELFVTLADADYEFARARPAERQSVQAEALGALQRASSGPASRAVLSAAADKKAGPQAVQRRTLVAKWSQLETQIAADFAAAKIKDANVVIKTQAGIDAQLKTIDQQISRRAPDYYAIINPAPLPLTDIQAVLRNDETALLIVPGARGTHVMAITHKDVSWHEAKMNAQELAEAVKVLRKSLDPRYRPASAAKGWAFDRQTAYQVYQKLLDPVAPTLRGKTRLFVVAGGALSMLPLTVLVTQPPKGSDSDANALRSTAWFADAFELSQLPSLQSLKTLRNRASGQGRQRHAMLGFGDPQLEGNATLRGGPDNVRGIALESLLTPAADSGTSQLANVALLRRMARLPGTAGELNQLRDIVGPAQSRIFLRSDATEAAVKHSDLSNLRILAFATHGLMAGAAGLDEPGLVLTPPRHATEQDDGLLTPSEIVPLNLGVDWVILSACDTAGGSDGVAMSGLAQAFLASGAESLLVSHWPVFDAVAGDLTTRTLKDLQTAPSLTRAGALQRTMRAVRTMPGHPEFAHPAYWAPFVLIGDGARH